MNREERLEEFGRLLDVMQELRLKCPWDKKQTNESLLTNTVEEVYELCDALIRNDNEDIRKELGDVLLQVVFYALIGEEKGAFDIGEVCHTLCEKLIYRHPHVFGSAGANTSKEVEKNWEQLKLKEKGGNKTVLEGVPAGLPALIKAYRIQDKARNAGFDWEIRRDVWEKVREEYSELAEEIEHMDGEHMEEEFGDLLFSLVNAARLYGINPEVALERTNRKFISRFNYMEQSVRKEGRAFKELTPGEQNLLWDEAKRQ
ncbi:MAG: nucleoside triphosphate pyrophosphohydrolase [Tannerellaceae bacterium]|jgi:XTP/dITP diphosphohydrolase|nr:nucleoside triphosphate pyrophosphohydrolase [Tannerellaceae bacterium]